MKFLLYLSANFDIEVYQFVVYHFVLKFSQLMINFFIFYFLFELRKSSNDKNKILNFYLKTQKWFKNKRENFNINTLRYQLWILFYFIFVFSLFNEVWLNINIIKLIQPSPDDYNYFIFIFIFCRCISYMTHSLLNIFYTISTLFFL